MLEVTSKFNAVSCQDFNDGQSPSITTETKSIFHLVKIRDKQKLIDSLTGNAKLYNLQSIDEYGEIPLMVACKHKRTANAFTLLDFYGEEASPGFISADGLSALYYSITSINLTERLLSYKSVLLTLNHVFPCGNTIMTLLLSRGITQNIEELIDKMDIQTLNHRNKSGKTCLILLCEIGQYQLCRKLLLRGINVQIYDNAGCSAIYYLMFEIEKNVSKERLDICFMCFENGNIKQRSNELKSYCSSDFDSIGHVNTIDVVSTYGELKWVIDQNGEVKIIKFFKSYKESKLIPDDLVKELVFIKELKNHSQNIIDLDGVYSDLNGNIHLVFEPLALTLRDYFYLLKLYGKIDSMGATMSQMRIEKGYTKLRTALDVIHNLGYLHNDVKLNNIMVGYDGQLRIIDFGISNFIGFSPYERIIGTYLTTTDIKAPDYGRKLKVNFLTRISSSSYKAVRSIIIESSRKSYNSDIYSLSVSFIQGILGYSRRYVSFESNIYEVIVTTKMEKLDENKEKGEKGDKGDRGDRGEDETLDICKISDVDLKKLKKYSFYHDIEIGVSIDSISRVKKVDLYTNLPITDFKSHHSLSNHRVRHYNTDEIKNTKYELSRYKSIFGSYSDVSINMDPGIYSDIVMHTFSRILEVIKNKISIDTYYNAVYNSVNYKGNTDMKVVCITYLFIFSNLFEWNIPSIVEIANEFGLPVDMLIGNVNSLISILLPNIKIIPFVLIVENIVIKSQLFSVPSDIISNIEKTVLTNILKYISGDKQYYIPNIDIVLWDFVQCFAYSTCSFLPFEIAYESKTILNVFDKFC